jgi:2-iminobutanoate/2-iminopropanoate deaminase
MAKKIPVVPNDMAKPGGVWTPAMACEPGRMVFISGMTARDASGAVVGEGDYAAQTRQVCENLKKAVEAAGGTLDDIMQVTVFAVDVEQFDAIHRVRREYFPENPPASTMVQISRLNDPRFLIEINAIAVL